MCVSSNESYCLSLKFSLHIFLTLTATKTRPLVNNKQYLIRQAVNGDFMIEITSYNSCLIFFIWKIGSILKSQLLMSLITEYSPRFSEENMKYMSGVEKEIYICKLRGTLRTYTWPPIKLPLAYMLVLLFFFHFRVAFCVLVMVVCIAEW